MRPSLTVLLLLLASCAEPSGPAVPTLESTPLSTVSTIRPVEGNCREYTVPITVGGKEEQAYGKACQQPDGTWQIVAPSAGPEGAAGAPSVAQSTIIYPAYPYYYYDPWWGPPWWGFGGFVGFGFHDHHHHHHDGGHHGRHH